MSAKIITQEGTPVDGCPEENEEPTLAEDLRALAEDVNEGLVGFRKFRNSAILKIGIVAVAIKVVGVVGQIIIENQRLKAARQERQEERDQNEA